MSGACSFFLFLWEVKTRQVAFQNHIDFFLIFKKEWRARGSWTCRCSLSCPIVFIPSLLGRNGVGAPGPQGVRSKLSLSLFPPPYAFSVYFFHLQPPGAAGKTIQIGPPEEKLKPVRESPLLSLPILKLFEHSCWSPEPNFRIMERTTGFSWGEAEEVCESNGDFLFSRRKTYCFVGLLLCTFNDLCPRGQGKMPVWNTKLPGDSWVPYS